MTKEKLANELVSNSNLTKSQAITAVEVLMQSAANAFMRGENICLRGFGTFRIEQRAAKNARNIRKGTVVTIPERKVVKFIPCKELKEQISNCK